MGLACLDVLSVLVFYEIYVEGIKMFKGFNNVGNVWVPLLKGPTRGPKEEPKAGRDTALTLSIDGPNDWLLVPQRPIDQVSSTVTCLVLSKETNLSKCQATEDKHRPRTSWHIVIASLVDAL